MTSRNQQLLKNVCHRVYEVKALDETEALRLFCFHAFKEPNPPIEYEKTSRRATASAGGSPLALTVLGSHLYGRDIEVKDLIDRSLLTCVSGEKIVVHDLLKEMAWNIVNEEPTLHKRSRLVDPDDIHKLLTTREVKYWPTLLLNPFKAVDTFLRRMEEHRTTEGISLDLSKAKEMYLEADAFDGMNFLTVLKFIGDPSRKKIHLPYGGLNSLPDGLRFLQWGGYPSKSLPSKFRPQYLVHLIINKSPIRRCWEGQPQLVNLIVLDLSNCINLIAIPNISRSSNLEELLLYQCESLVEVPSHVQYLTKIITLDLRGCINLKRLPPKLDSKLLKHVRMSNCLKVTHCPEMNSRELEELDLYETSLVELPNAIYNVKKDGVLSLYGKNITKFPAVTTSLEEYRLGHTSIREMDLHDYHHHQGSSDLVLPRFGGLNLYENSQLKSLPESVWNMVSYGLVIRGSPLIESLPEILEPVNGLSRLLIMNCGGLKSLPSNLGNIKSLTWLYLSNTGITSLPFSIQELQQLTEVDLSDCKSLVSIPSFPSCPILYIRGCVSIRSLPELPPNLEILDVSGCKSLQALPSNTGKLLHLEFLDFDDCPQLDKNLPAELVANFLAHASLVSSYRQCNIFCSRSELPEWFTYKSENPKMVEDCIVKAIAFGVVGFPQPMLKAIAFGVVGFPQPDYSRIFTGCECKVDNTTVASWSFNYLWDECVNQGLSEKLWLVFDNDLLGDSHCKGEGDEAWYVKYAGLAVSFEFLCSKEEKIKACGVSLLY
ncbi:Disease resistance protein RPV1 [Linum perenne]